MIFPLDQWLAADVAPHPHLKTCRHVMRFSVPEEALSWQELIVDAPIVRVQPIHPLGLVAAEIRR